MTRAAIALTSFIFFLSGVAALIFEALWFRQAGLAFGNSVWASAIVVSSYMAGLAVGNGLAARYGQHLKNAIAVYAGLEVLIAVSGVALVMLLPSITTVVASLLRPLFETSTLVHSARFLIGFVILLAPAIAMGATMPVLVRAVAGSSRSFGQVLGLLYGANTLGAVVGAVTSEFIWTPRVGIIGSALVAASFNLLAAALAIGISRRTFQVPSPTAEPTEIARPPISLRAYLLLLASFGTGGILLALEIVWFRILKLFLHPLPEVFATLLAIVLAGIGLGGLLASVWLRLQPSAHKYVSSLALASGILTIVGYVSSQTIAQTIDRDYDYFSFLFNLSIPLMLGVSLLSGVLFPLLGQRLRDELNTDVGSAGLLTLANTAGATVGPLAAAFVLLPRLGMERSILFLALAYGGVAILALTKEEL
ncbi:MAG: spermidine synthase, partial [Myxococcota bacterium]